MVRLIRTETNTYNVNVLTSAQDYKTMETKTKLFNDIEIQIFKIAAVGVIVALAIA